MKCLGKNSSKRALCAVLPILAGLAACGAPHIAGLQPEMVGMDKPRFRDLADIPDRPRVTDSGVNTQTIQSLAQDRAKTDADAKDLRGQKVIPPEPVTPPSDSPP